MARVRNERGKGHVLIDGRRVFCGGHGLSLFERQRAVNCFPIESVVTMYSTAFEFQPIEAEICIIKLGDDAQGKIVRYNKS